MIFRSISILIVVFFLSASAKEKQKFIISPIVTEPSEFVVGDLRNTLFIGSIEDLINADSTIVGYTRKGMDTSVQIICIPSPSVVLQKSLKTVLTHLNKISTDASTAQKIISCKITTFSLKEKTHRILQTIEAEIRIEVVLTDPYDSTKTKKFIISSQKSRTALDTTRHAENVLREAVKSALIELLKSAS